MTTNQFITALNAGPKRTTTTNGADSFTATGVENPLVALSFKLVRDLKSETLETMMQAVLTALANDNSIVSMTDLVKLKRPEILDLFVLAFQTRDVRGGKGERSLFYQMFLWLYQKFGTQTLELLKLIPHYGSYKDLREIWALTLPNSVLFAPLKQEIVKLFANQLVVDRDTPADKSISLAGKWAPREKSAHHDLAKALANYLFPTTSATSPASTSTSTSTACMTTTACATTCATTCASVGATAAATGAPQKDQKEQKEKTKANSYHSRKEYRKLLTALNKRLKTIEDLMCNGKWSDIDPAGVPAQNLKIHRKAFMNVDKKGSKRSDLDDRVTCAKHFAEFMEKSKLDPTAKKLHGENLHPHELVKAYLDQRGTSYGGAPLVEDAILEAQFASLCYSILNPPVLTSPPPATAAATVAAATVAAATMAAAAAAAAATRKSVV